MEKKFWITVEDSTMAFTSAFNAGQFMTRFVEVGVASTSRQNAEQIAKKIVSDIHMTNISLLSIAN